MNRDELQVADPAPGPSPVIESHEPQPAKLALGAAAGVGVVALAGWFTGIILVKGVGEPALILLWLGGYLSGTAARRITTVPAPWLGVVLGVGCFAAAAFAEAYWIRFTREAGESGWLASFAALREFVDIYPMSTFIATLCAGFGAYAAYRECSRVYHSFRGPAQG